MNEEKVSIVMPTYNGEKYLERSIKSILNQSYQNFEFLIIDDGSIDNSAKIIKSFNDVRIKYIFQENQGPVFAYNTGFRNATGKYIIIQDHDDYSNPYRVEMQLEFMLRNNLDICGSKYEIFYERNGFIEKVERVYSSDELREILLFLPWAICTPTICLKKEVFIKYGYYDESYRVAYDYEFLIRVLNNVKMGIVPEFLFRWYHHRSSYSSVTSVAGRNVFRKIALSKINEKRINLSDYKFHLYVGLLNYYSDCLFQSFLHLSRTMIYKIEKKNVKYLFAVVFGGTIIKYTRRHYLFGLPILRSLKKYFMEV